MSTQSCQQCNGTLSPIATYADYIAATETATDERKFMHSYLQGQPKAVFSDFLECQSCGFIRIHPLPEPSLLQDFYQKYYANSQYDSKAEKKIRRTRKRLGTLPSAARQGTFLDVGCNLGFAVEAARLEGFTASGIEIDAAAVAIASARFPESRFTATTIEAYQPGETYNLVHCTEVLEHVVDTVAFARQLARLTTPGGYLYLTTPDAGHWRRPRNFIEWPEVKPPEHINWQNKKTLRTLLMNCGFEAPKFAFKWKPGITLLARRKPN